MMWMRQIPKTTRTVRVLASNSSSSLLWNSRISSSRGVLGPTSSSSQTLGFGKHPSGSVSWPALVGNLCGFSSDSDGDSDSDGPVASAVNDTPAERFLDASARGFGQVIFLNSRQSGQIVAGGLLIGDPFLFGLATLGTVTATATSKWVGLEQDSIDNGLLGYNGCLVGCAAAVFSPSVLAATTLTLVGASATPFVAVSLKEAMGSVPQWTFAFNFVALTSILKTRPLLPAPVDEAAASAAETTATKGSVFLDVLASPLTGVSQIFVVQSPLTGAILLGGIGSYSPLLAVHALGGSTLGMLVGAMSGAPLEELTMGLYGFNSALTSMAVGVFFVHSTPSMMLSAGGAAATASLFGAMKTAFGAYGSPCLTLPFCVTMSACYLLGTKVPGLVLASNPHSPEKNEE